MVAQVTSQKELENQANDHKKNSAISDICCHSSTVNGTECFGEICPISRQRS
jgi:hypothetical protein